MYTIILLLHVLIAIALITLVLVQQGRGAEAGAAFGSGASSTVFGSRGSASFLSRVTGGLATAFFISSLTLAYFVTQDAPEGASITERLGTIERPATDETTPSLPDGDVPVPSADSSDVPAATSTTNAGTDAGANAGDGASDSDIPAPSVPQDN